MLHTMVMGLACDCNKHINNFSVFTLHSWWGSTNTSPGISNCRQRRLESIHLSNISSFHQGVPSILTFSVSLLKGFIYLHHLQTACVCGGVYWQKCNCIYCSNQIHNILNACRYVTRNMFQLARCVCVCVWRHSCQTDKFEQARRVSTFVCSYVWHVTSQLQLIVLIKSNTETKLPIHTLLHT